MPLFYFVLIICGFHELYAVTQWVALLWSVGVVLLVTMATTVKGGY